MRCTHSLIIELRRNLVPRAHDPFGLRQGSRERYILHDQTYN